MYKRQELLQDSANNDEEVVETPISIEVIDAVAKKEPGFVAGFGDKVHVEFVVALKRGAQLKTVGKRYSELEEFHAVLLSHNLVDRLQAPPFPEKQTFRDSWYKFDATDVNSDFVRNRRVALDQYLRNLFGTFPTLYSTSRARSPFLASRSSSSKRRRRCPSRRPRARNVFEKLKKRTSLRSSPCPRKLMRASSTCDNLWYYSLVVSYMYMPARKHRGDGVLAG